MRMWGVNPIILCNKHLLGEHGEIHKHRHNFVKQHKITKRIYPVVQIESENMEIRHNELVNEMLRRKFNHQSPYSLPDLSYLSDNERYAKIDVNNSIDDLINRCNDCNERYFKYLNELYYEL